MPDVPEVALVEWIKECVVQLRDASEFAVAAAHADDFRLLHGLIARAIRYSNAYMTLVDAGMEGDASPLARAALEHAITLQWVFVVDGGIVRYRNSVAHDRLSHYRNLAEWFDHHELREAVKQLGPLPPGKQLGSFTSMLRELDADDKFLEASYHILSQHVHVTHSAVVSFLQQGGEELYVLYDQEYVYRYQATYICAAACMLARWVLARLTNDEALLAKLDRRSDELHLPMHLADRVMAPLRRRNGI